MRWELKSKYNEGDVRLVNKFCLLPLKLYKKYRWLESAWIIQIYLNNHGWVSTMFVPTEIFNDVKELFQEGKGKETYNVLFNKENDYLQFQSEDILKRMKIKEKSKLDK